MMGGYVVYVCECGCTDCAGTPCTPQIPPQLNRGGVVVVVVGWLDGGEGVHYAVLPTVGLT